MIRPLCKFALALVASAAAGLAPAQSATSTPQAAPTASATTTGDGGPPATQSRGQALLDTTSHRDAQARIGRNVADAASPPHGPAAAASAAAAATAEHHAKAEADADLAARRVGDRGRLKIDRETLTGDAAKAALLRHGLGQPNYDHSISMGDKDHIEQVTNFRVYVQKPAPGQ